MFIHWSWHNEPVIKLLDLNQKWVWRMDNVWRKEKWQHSSKPVGGVYRITVGIFGMVYQHQWYVIRMQEWRSICHRMVALYFFNIFFLYVLFRCLPLYTFVVLVRQPREKKKKKTLSVEQNYCVLIFVSCCSYCCCFLSSFASAFWWWRWWRMLRQWYAEILNINVPRRCIGAENDGGMNRSVVLTPPTCIYQIRAGGVNTREQKERTKKK